MLSSFYIADQKVSDLLSHNSAVLSGAALLAYSYEVMFVEDEFE